MTDNTQKLDIAQRIAEALARTSKPKEMSDDGDFKPDEDTPIGEVPGHLRHLHNLLDELSEEASAAERSLHEAKERHAAVHTIFFQALRQHVLSDNDQFDGIKLCNGWQVVGYKCNEDEMVSLESMLTMATMGGRS